MNYVIFDLEWNQPPDDASALLEPIYFPGDIIEIGAAKLDDRLPASMTSFWRSRVFPSRWPTRSSSTGVGKNTLL